MPNQAGPRQVRWKAFSASPLLAAHCVPETVCEKVLVMRGQKTARCLGRACVVLGLCMACVCLAYKPCWAKTDFRNASQVADSVAEARVRELKRAAQKAYEENALHLAYRLLEEAFRMRADSETLFLLGRLAHAEHRSVEAFDLFRRYQQDLSGPLDEEHRLAEKTLSEPLPPAGELLILGEKGSLVLVDERVVGSLPLALPLLLAPGKHQVVLELGGRRKQEEIEVQSGENWLLRSQPETDDLNAVPAPSIVLLPHFRGVAPDQTEHFSQSLGQATTGTGHVLKSRETALALAPQLENCLDSLLCQEDLGKRNQAEYVLLLHVENSGLGKQTDWRLHLSLVDVAVGDRSASATQLCSNCTVQKAAQLAQTTFEQALGMAAARVRGILQVRSTPSRAEVFVGDRKLGITPLQRPVWAGKMALQVRRPGVPTFDGEVTVEPNRTVSLSIELGEADPNDETRPKKKTKQPLQKKWWFWTVGGVVLGGASLGLVLGLVPRQHVGVSWVQ